MEFDGGVVEKIARRPRPGSDPSLAELSVDAINVSVLDTTELRWFAVGSLDPMLLRWFTREGSTGVIEERSDIYRLDGRVDRGVKLRFGETLELKRRLSVDELVRLGDGLTGRIEAWRKWSPATGLVDTIEGAPWAEVDKTVVKRRFTVDGSEVLFADGLGAVGGAGCDVEIAAVTVGQVQAWTFAFAAFGPEVGRRASMLAAHEVIVGGGAYPHQFEAFGDACGYPQWLRVAAPAPFDRTG